MERAEGAARAASPVPSTRRRPSTSGRPCATRSRPGCSKGRASPVAGRQITSHQGLEDAFPSWNPFPPGQAGVLVKSRDEMIEQVRLQVKDGVDTIKVSGSNDSAVSDEPLGRRRVHRRGVQADRRRSAPPQPDRDGACRSTGIDALGAPGPATTGSCTRRTSTMKGSKACLKNGVSLCPTLTLLVNIVDSHVGSGGASIIDVFKREVDAAESPPPRT